MDSTISNVLPFVIRKRQPSRPERDKFDCKVLALIKQYRLSMQDGILYRVIGMVSGISLDNAFSKVLVLVTNTKPLNSRKCTHYFPLCKISDIKTAIFRHTFDT